MENDVVLNNPFNLEINPNIHWLGTVPDNPSSKTFCQFMTPAWGLRAGFVNLKTQIREGFDTIAKLINKYAPAKDHNDVPAYVKALCKALDKNPDDTLTSYDIKALGKAIITHEQGRLIYTDLQLDTALHCAGVTVDAAIKPTNGSKPNPIISWLHKFGLFR